MLTKDSNLNQKNHIWIITESGRQAIADNFYLNQRGTQNQKLFFQLGGFFIALIGLIISIYSLLQNNSLENRINKIESKNQLIFSK
jgi:uncharacterized membrane protein YidH (DUF202 family)